MPMLSLAEAAKHCGVNRSTILRAVKSGKMSGTRNDDGSWSVEALEDRTLLSTLDRKSVV